jgi:2-polyprenyl-3-methyl-5-hydroxy-6-metoxy-1,4-benzoquinol methylase
VDSKELREALSEVANEYPAEMVQDQLVDLPRIAFNIGLALEGQDSRSPKELSICDLGGGIGLFSVGCAAIGMKRVVLVDDFSDEVNLRVGDSVLDLHRKYGVEVVSRDVVAEGIAGAVEGEFDVITTFDSMEHWHHSPKRLFHQVVERLSGGGTFVVGVPNCVNLRKRITVPFGHGKWSGIEEWYDVESFRGHVREPDVADLRYIAHDMGLVDVRVLGRNWLGYYSGNPAIRLATRIFDRPMRLKASLCSDIYMIGRKA